MQADNDFATQPRLFERSTNIDNAERHELLHTSSIIPSATKESGSHCPVQSTLIAESSAIPAESIPTSNLQTMGSTNPPPTPLTPSFAEPIADSSVPSTPRTNNPVTPTLMDYEPIPQSRPVMERQSEAQTAANERDLLTRRFQHLLRPLAPLLSIETGLPHPRFPKTLLDYHLLTQAELDDLAHFYHQRTPNDYSTEYPMPVIARWACAPDPTDSDISSDVEDLSRMLGAAPEVVRQTNSKRRRFGRFMGLQGMESADAEREGYMREEMERWVEREMAKREARDREREAWRWKGYQS